MIPVNISTSPLQTSPPLVNTTTPGTNETRVPPTAVAPSVSSPQIDTNARGNNSLLARKEAPAAAPSSPSVSFTATAGVPQPAQTYTLGAQVNFLAQLIGQDTSAPTQRVLVEYEKLANIAGVKYKPSNAGKPEASVTSSLFDEFLLNERTQTVQARTQAQNQAQIQAQIQAQTQAQTTTAASIAAQTAEASISPPVLLQAEAKPAAKTTSLAQAIAEELAEEEAAFALENLPQPRASTPSVIGAYLNTAARISTQSQQSRSLSAPISEVA
jgi:hypothetical protein